MKAFISEVPIILTGLALNGCAAGPQGAGYWFHIIFILIPIIVMGLLLLKRIDTVNDSLHTIEGQLRRLSGRLDNLEERMKGSNNGKKEQ